MVASLMSQAAERPGLSRGDEAGTEEREVLVARTETAGTLASVIGDRKLSVDSIVVEGPINEADFDVLWEASFYGKTYGLSLEKATVEEGRIPDNAFFRKEVQKITDEKGKVTKISGKLRHVVLGALDEVGDDAFYYSRNLETVRFTGPVRRLGKGSFQYCAAIGDEERLRLPEGLEEVDEACFWGAGKLESYLPATLRIINRMAFSFVDIDKLEFPESLEFLGYRAFSESTVREVFFPDTDVEISYYGSQFYRCVNLEVLRMPSRQRVIQSFFVNCCYRLKEFVLPPELEVIGYNAFGGCEEYVTGLYEIPEGCVKIDDSGFNGCINLESVVLPSTLETIGEYAFLQCDALKSVYCKAAVPPAYNKTGDFIYVFDPDPDNKEVVNKTLYVPEGTSELYANSKVWKNFAKIVELSPEEFGQVGAIDAAVADNGGAEITADGEEICICGAGGETYTVCGVDGRVVASGVTAAGETRIAVSGGIYVVKVGGTVCKLAL